MLSTMALAVRFAGKTVLLVIGYLYYRSGDQVRAEFGAESLGRLGRRHAVPNNKRP